MIKALLAGYSPPLFTLWFGFAFLDESVFNHWWSAPALGTLVIAFFIWAAFCGSHFD